MMKRVTNFFPLMLATLACLLFAQAARADYVGELETTKYFDQTTIDLITTRLGQGTGLLTGDQISYFIQFTPTDNGGSVAGGGYVTDYIPAGTQVVGAQFVRLNSDGTYTQVAPPTPAAEFPAQVPLYSDTGIFYSTDARTAVSPANTTITSANGTALPGGTGCSGISLPSTSHNAWDNAMVTAFVSSSNNSSGTCAAPPAITYSTYGLSPVAGPDTYLTADSTGAVGPWQRISYPGSMKGTATGISVTGYANNAAVANACVGGTPTAAGWNLSSANPLPINTKAVRFAAGKVSVGELFSVRITLKLTANMPATGIINNTEVFGGDASLDPGNGAAHPGIFSQWRYFCPAVAASNSNLLVLKNLVGACTGAGCTPTAVTAGVVPSAANLKLRYTIQYLNLGGTAQTNVVLKDTMATGAAYVAASAVQLSGAAIGAPTAAGQVLTFPTIASLGAGAGGKIQYDVNIATAPADGVALTNIAQLVSTQVPSPGITSKAIATVSTQANLWIGKSTGTPSVVPGNTASYTITIPNNGTANATAIVVKDYLPSAGGATASDRFAYVANSVVATITNAAGTSTTVTPTVTSAVAAAAPYAGLNRELVTITLPTTTAVTGCPANTTCIPSFGKLTITFNATVGSNVPASAMPYMNDANVWYSGGAGGAAANSNMSETIGSAPVKITAPMSLAATVDCVYAGAVCVPYTNGTIAPLSKIKYKLSYNNISAAVLNSVIVTDTLPANTTFVAGTALQNGIAAFAPTVAGQVLTFPTIAALGAAPASGYITFDVQFGAAVTSGTDITNTAKITAATFLAGVQASVTTSVRDQANLQITKTVSPFVIQIGGTVTYTLTVTNTGNAPASGIKIYDELPYTGSAADALARFNYAAAGMFTLNDATNVGHQLVAVTPTLSVPPTFTGYTVQTNRQELFWNFAPAGAHANDYLSAGGSFTLTYTATAGANVPASATPYTSDVQAEYISATNTLYASTTNTAAVTIGALLDHYELSLPTAGITCLPTAVTVTACADTSSPCSNPYTSASGTTATLATNGGALGATTVTFNASGVASTTLSYPAAADGTPVSVTLSGEQTVATNSRKCCPNGVNCAAANSCSSTFNTAGFIFSSATNGAVATISTQVAGTSSGTYYLRAVKTIDNSSHTCGAALTGAQSVNFAYECNNPTTCYAANLMSVNGGAATPIQRNNNGGVASYTGVNMTFDANGNAPFTFNYSDAGQVKLWANKTVSSASLAGSSNAFVVRPAGFVLSGIQQTAAPNLANPSAADAAGAKFIKAGGNFSVTATAVTSTGSTAYSYGNETSPESVKLTSALVSGLGLTNNPTIGGAFGAFGNGVASGTAFTWDEVGIITLTPSVADADYLGAGNITGTVSGNVGRFYPARFGLSAGSIINRADLCPAAAGCPSAFTYMGEQMNAVFTLTAQAVGGATTGNYAGAFAKLDSTVFANLNMGAVDRTTAPATPFLLTPRISVTGMPAVSCSPCFTAGVAIVTAPFMITRAGAPDGAYTAVDIGINPADADGVTVPFDMDITSLVAPLTSDRGKVGVSDLRYGRLKLSNAHGSELLPLSVAVTAQYWNGSAYVTSAADNVTQFNTKLNTAGGNVRATIVKAPLALANINVVTPGLVTFANGLNTFKLGAPSVAGSADFDIITAPGYLLPSTAGRATFGIYKGNNDFIYIRESY